VFCVRRNEMPGLHPNIHKKASIHRLRLIAMGASLFVASAAAASEAVLSSRHAVYAVGEAIDVTFWVGARAGGGAPRFEVRGVDGGLVGQRLDVASHRARGLDGRARAGPIPAEGRYVERVEDLRDWFEMSPPGSYEVRLLVDPVAAGGDEIASNSVMLEVVPAAALERRSIPLGEVDAVRMPGTRPLSAAMRDDGFGAAEPGGELVDEILRALAYDPIAHPVAPPGFAVAGMGQRALRGAHAVLVGGDVPRASFRAGEPLSLVFFSYSFNHYVRLVSVEQDAATIQISHDFVPHDTKEMTSHLALIPVSGLPVGDIRVVNRLELALSDTPAHLDEVIRRIVSGSHEFTIH
jgi:hypothetical protein